MILTTSQMLTTGVDAPMVKNVVIARAINSMTDFKQIIGRGTRVRDDYEKFFFTILDYTGSATRMFADREFDGDPALIREEEVNEAGEVTTSTIGEAPDSRDGGDDDGPAWFGPLPPPDDEEAARRKYYVDGKWVEIAASLVYELDDDGKRLGVVRLTDYTQRKVRELFTTAAALRARWARTSEREGVLAALAERGIDIEYLREATGQPEADPFDLLCHVVYSAPLRTRRERADRLRKEHREFFERFSAEARAILEMILQKYADHGPAQLTDPRILKTPPLSDHGNILEIARHFGGPGDLRSALEELQSLLYAA